MKYVIYAIALSVVASNDYGFAFTPNVPSTSPSRYRRHYPTRTPTFDKAHPDPISINKRTITPLQASPLVTIASSPIGSLAVLASIVLIHECGHYFAARTFGIKVEEFSVGVGPRLGGFNAFGNDFSLRALPLGGYVKFPENYNITQAQAIEIADNEAFEEYIQQQKLDVGAQILNALTLGAYVDKMWTDEKNRRKEMVAAGTTISTFWEKITGKAKKAVDIPGINEIDYYDDPTLLQNRPWQERMVVLSGGVVFNLLLAFFIYFGQIGFGAGLPQPIFNAGVVVSVPPLPDAAASGLLRKGDVIVGINGVSVSGSQSPSAIQSQKAISDFISTIRKTPEGESLLLEVVRLDRSGTATNIEVNVKPKRSTNENGPQTIGVLLAPNFVKSEILKTDSKIEAAALASKYVWTLTSDTANGLLQVFLSLVSGSGGSSGVSQVSGPIGLIRTGSEIVATKDITTVLLFAAAISINLGVVNALPIPALDGGQLLFVLAEAVTGRKVDQRLQEGVTSVAVLFLILLSVSTLFGDLSSIFGS